MGGLRKNERYPKSKRALKEFVLRSGALFISFIPMFIEMIFRAGVISSVLWKDVPFNHVMSGRILFMAINIMAVTSLNIYIERKKIDETMRKGIQVVAKFTKNTHLLLVVGGVALYTIMLIVSADKIYELNEIFISLATLFFIFFGFCSSIFVSTCYIKN